ncbi:unnamed protein product [Closterium sp. NIES-53]
MALLRILVSDHEGRPIQFDTWLDDLQLYLLRDSKDSVSLFDLAPGAAIAPPATANSATRSQWLTHDAAARLAIRNHLSLAECAHFGQHRTAQALYDAVVARYSSPATAALGRLLVPYLFPELSAFAMVEDLVSHLHASDACYRATVPAEFLNKNPPPMFITLYFIVTRLPDSLRSVRDHFLSLDPTSLTIDLLEKHLLAAETSVVAVGAARGTPHTPFFEGCSPSPLAPSYAFAVAADVPGSEDVGAASASAKHRSSKGKGGRGGGGDSGSGGGGRSGGSGGGGGGGGGGTGGGGGGSGGGGGGSSGRGGSGGGGTGGGRTGARRGGSSGGQRQQQQRRSETRSPQQLRIAAAALSASESGTLPAAAPTKALHTFTLDSGASQYFFCDSKTLTPLPAPVLVRLADPSGGPVVACSSTVLPCPAVSSGSLSGLHLPLFSMNLVSTAAFQDAMVTTTIPGGSSLYTLATETPQVAASTQVSASSSTPLLVSPPVHQTLLWHHRLGHPSLPRLRGMHSRLLVFGLPRSLPPLSPSPAPPCLPCVEGRQRATPHSSSFPPTTAPPVQGHERYFLLVVDDYTQYTTVFPLRSKGQVFDVLIPWIRAVRLQLRERFRADLPVLRLHSERGGEFSSDLLRDFCRGEGILPSFTLPQSPQQYGIAKRRIGLVMEVARTSMSHAAAPHFLWPFAVHYDAHQLNLWPRVSLPETSPALRWTGKAGDASVFRDVTFDESVPFYRLLPYRSAHLPPPPLFLAPGPPPVDPLPPQGHAPSGMSQVDPPPGAVLGEVAVDSGAARSTASGGAETEGVGPGGAESGGTETGGAEPGGGETGGAEPGGAEPEGVEARGAGVTAGAGVPGGTATSGPGGGRTRGTGAAGTGGVGGAGAGDPTESGAAGAGGAGAGGAGDAGAGVGGTGTAGAGVGGTGAGSVGAGVAGAVDLGGTGQPRPYFVPLLQQVLGVPSSTALTPPLLCPPPDHLTERREPASRPASPVRTGRRVPSLRPPPVPSTHAMTLCPSSVPLRVPLPGPPESSLPKVPDPESDRARAVSPTVSRLLANAVTDPSFESAAASILVAELLDFAAACCLDYTTALVAESASVSPLSVGGECALGTDVLDDIRRVVALICVVV